MPEPADQKELYALRGQVRLAGQEVADLKRQFLPYLQWSASLVGAFLVSVLAGSLLGPENGFGFFFLLFAGLCGCLVLPAGIVLLACFLAYPWICFEQARQRRRLRRELCHLSSPAAANLLGPLKQDECPETRELARRLSRDLRSRSTELVPARAPVAGSRNRHLVTPTTDGPGPDHTAAPQE